MAEIPSFMIKALISTVNNINTVIQKTYEPKSVPQDQTLQIVMCIIAAVLLMIAFTAFGLTAFCCRRNMRRRRRPIYNRGNFKCNFIFFCGLALIWRKFHKFCRYQCADAQKNTHKLVFFGTKCSNFLF